MPVVIDKRLLNDRQAAEYLGVSRAAVWGWTKDGLLSKVPLPGRRLARWDVVDLDAFVDERKNGRA